jgi:hypothetical protein
VSQNLIDTKNTIDQCSVADPDPGSGAFFLAQSGSGSTKSSNSDPMRIRIHNRTFEENFLFQVYKKKTGLWIRIPIRIWIGSGFNDFVDPDPVSGSKG